MVQIEKNEELAKEAEKAKKLALINSKKDQQQTKKVTYIAKKRAIARAALLGNCMFHWQKNASTLNSKL